MVQHAAELSLGHGFRHRRAVALLPVTLFPLALVLLSPVAQAAAKEQTIEVREENGTMVFVPARVEVARGDTVRFSVRNGGALPHEFVVGTKAANAAHARMMAAMPGMKHHDANAISLQPGQAGTLNWRFARAGTFEFACLLPGHYAAGMHERSSSDERRTFRPSPAALRTP